jgi:ABC-type multidrug transport system fused ATPase/permease subunit
LRESIGYVSQEPVLILGTIRENLAYGKVNASEKDMRDALEQASAQFVYSMEKGLDTYVGSGSVMNLSGGQK